MHACAMCMHVRAYILTANPENLNKESSAQNLINLYGILLCSSFLT